MSQKKCYLCGAIIPQEEDIEHTIKDPTEKEPKIGFIIGSFCEKCSQSPSAYTVINILKYLIDEKFVREENDAECIFKKAHVIVQLKSDEIKLERTPNPDLVLISSDAPEVHLPKGYIRFPNKCKCNLEVNNQDDQIVEIKNRIRGYLTQKGYLTKEEYAKTIINAESVMQKRKI